MDADNRPMLLELCHIFHKRNLIEKRRNSARYKIDYYKKIKRAVEGWQESNYEYRRDKQRYDYLHARWTAGAEVDTTELHGMQGKLAWHRDQFVIIQAAHKRPKKWMNKLSEVKRLILKYQGEYTKAKYDAMTLTKRTRKRVRTLTQALGMGPSYNCGQVVAIVNRNVDKLQGFFDPIVANVAEIKKLHDEYVANKAVERMLGSK